MTVVRLLCAALLTLSPLAARAEDVLTPAQALDFQRVGDLHFSPDGRKLAYLAVSYEWDWRPHLRILDVASGATEDLTPSGKAERAPQWSPDGKTLAFLSNRGGHTEVYATVPGGTPVALTAAKDGVSDYRWSPDGRSIAYLAQADDAPDSDNGPHVADDPAGLDRLWVVDVASKVVRAVPAPGYRIDEFQWRTKDELLLIATDAPRIEEDNTAVYALPNSGGVPRLIASPPQPMESLIVSPDGRTFAVNATSGHGPVAHDLFAGGDGALRDVTSAIDRTIVETRWHEPGTIWARVADGFGFRLYRIGLRGKAVAVPLPLSVGSFDVARDGAIAYVGEDFTHPAQIFLRRPDGRVRQLGHIAQDIAAHRLAPAEIFRTKSFDGTPIEAALMAPASPPPPGGYPLVLRVHGGPSSKFSASYNWETAWGELLVSHGYEVLMVNPRGSMGYGEDFLKANRGDWGGGDYKDLMAVLDAVIARGHTDPKRLGIGGWSYGGEMTAWAIGQSDRFKAAVDGAGVFDQAAEFETEESPASDEWNFGTPWENPDVFARNSPSTFIRHAHTPTLIVDGADDTSNPVGQSTGLYRALKHFGVETQLVTYPDEGHSPRKRAYNIDMFQRFLDWYDRHLKQ